MPRLVIDIRDSLLWTHHERLSTLQLLDLMAGTGPQSIVHEIEMAGSRSAPHDIAGRLMFSPVPGEVDKVCSRTVVTPPGARPVLSRAFFSAGAGRVKGHHC